MQAIGDGETAAFGVRYLELGVRFLEFGVRFKNSERGFRIWSEVKEFGVRFRIGSVVWNSECTCGPPYKFVSCTKSIKEIRSEL